MKTVLTIAGSDSSGGAGIQADIKTITCCGCYAESIVTALTAQNTLGVNSILNVANDFLCAQFDAVFTDIVPCAIKIGMVSSVDAIKIIAKKLQLYKGKNIVVDPVMVSTSGSKLIADDAVQVLCKELFPLAKIITPNIPEAEILCGKKITSPSEMESAAKEICSEYKCSVLLKGGHNINDANDFLCCPDGKSRWFKSKKINNPNTHGTGCTLSSAIASNLAKEFSLEKSVLNAKKYLSKCLDANLNLGKGSGPLKHNFMIH